MKNNNRNADIDFDKLIEVFNTEGKEAAKSFVELTYGNKYEVVQRRIKNETNYFFNRNTRKYEIKEHIDSNFMTIEELYEGTSKPSNSFDNYTERTDSFEHIEDTFKELMINLMKDKMQEINKFIYLEQSTKRVIIDLKRLEKNGYKVVIN